MFKHIYHDFILNSILSEMCACVCGKIEILYLYLLNNIIINLNLNKIKSNQKECQNCLS